MALNKKEKAHLESIESALKYQKQLTETVGSLIQPKIDPDVLPPSVDGGFGKLSFGWLYNSFSKIARKSCSSSISHCFGGTERTTTQGALAMYSSEALAMKAMRAEVAARMLDEIVKIDERIKALEAKNEIKAD